MENEKSNRIRIKLKAYNPTLLKTSCENILNTTSRTETKTVGPISIPTKRKIYCVLRSPHVDKDSREHFEIRVHKRILEIFYDSEVPIFNLLSEADLPPGIFYRICLF